MNVQSTCCKNEASRTVQLSVLLGMMILSSLIAGCAVAPPPPFVPKAQVVKSVVHCNDYTGHTPGNTPWAMGGKCTCTPTDELMAKLHAEGSCTSMSTAMLKDLYASKGIRLAGPGHMRCNGLCTAGPHVVLGGKCMCPPTPGTESFEKIVSP